MLQLQNVTKLYKTKAGIVNALDGISLTFPTTGLVFVTGKSGCGKTTLLNVIGGLDGIDGGEIFVQDKRFSTFSASEYDSYRNTFIGFIFQEYNLLPEFTVEKNIKMAMELQGRQADDEEFEQLLKDVGIDEFKTRYPSELSGGQRQRVAIARALVKQPRIIMADEPTGALDSDTGAKVLDALKKLSEKTLVIVVSHDREFAEKYADRIIHLVDGQVAQDITFEQKEIKANVSERENTLVIREGSDLTEWEKNAIAKAVKEHKSIEVVETLSYRDKAPTGEVKLERQAPVTFRKSKMKMRSAMHLGVKSLVVKPIRLILTILISAVAFAVFGLFDSIANFSTASVLKNQLEKVSLSDTVVASADYVIDYEIGDYYGVKLSKTIVDELQSQTDGVVKGIFTMYNGANTELSITELINASTGKGSTYYSRKLNGFVEFDLETEILHDGRFKDFSYKVAEGKYPTIGEKESPYQIAISTYLADSIRHYLQGDALNGKTINENKDFLGATLTVNAQEYTIVGLIDCGEIPEKYDPIKEIGLYSQDKGTLASDFKAYIDAGARKCLFVADGFLDTVKEENSSADTYQLGNVDWSMRIDGLSVTKKTYKYVYNAEQYGEENVLFFDGDYSDGNFSLADNEVLVHLNNLEDLFASQIRALPPDEVNDVVGLISQMKTGSATGNRNALRVLLENLGVELDKVNATITQRFKLTGTTVEKEVKIVGVYFGVAVSSSVTPNTYKIMMNETLMEELGVYAGQGDYTKLLFSEQSIDNGIDAIIDYMLAKEGLVLSWYSNSALNIIMENEMVIRQIADLFLYAAIALSLFSIFMLYNYITVSISNKKQSVGVLRALGAGGKNILCTFLSESMIVAVINGILSNIFAVLGCSFVNAYIVDVMNISVHFALFGIRQILIIAAISLITAILASTLPIVKISKKKPIELIRRP